MTATESQVDKPAHRYDATLADSIELKWQDYWATHGTFHTENPTGLLASPDAESVPKEKLFIMDMFPYPSGAGLHVGHPLGFIATDVYARFKRACGFNVLHTMGFDAFGLPAEEHARATGTHPRDNTNANIATYRRQLARLGLGHDRRRSISTADPSYYRWTQWIFLQIFNSWYDTDQDRARPIDELADMYARGERDTPSGEPWDDMSPSEQRRVLNEQRLAYLGEADVNWCPNLGTVLSNEEVTAEGLSERGDHPVFRRPLKQWMLRITVYRDRLLEDLSLLDWSDAIKTMQRNWIGRSEGAEVSFAADDSVIDVFTTRPDTLFGATYLVLAPEHPLVDPLTAQQWPESVDPLWTDGHGTPGEAVAGYRKLTQDKSDLDRQENKDKTGVFVGSYATNPANGQAIPVFVADYVLMGYGTGAIMAVPGQDERDWEFAEAFGLPIVRTVQPSPDFEGKAFTGDGVAINSDFLDGLAIAEAKSAMIAWLDANGHGRRTTTYKLRDWLFSRQRYWGEPFPIVYGPDGLAQAVPDSQLPVELPDLVDWAPRSLKIDSEPEPPLGRAQEWLSVDLDLGEGTETYVRELNTMPNWAGSCWYYLRYLDPANEDRLVDPEVERYWMSDEGSGGVDLYIGGVEHAVLHLLYARFWHKVLFDLGHVSGPEPFKRLINQGYIQAFAYQDHRGVYVEAADVEEREGRFFSGDEPVTRVSGKMGKSLKNSISPDDMYQTYGADTLRLHEMFMGPIDHDRPWDTSAVIGSHRLLQRVWRNLVDEDTGDLIVGDAPPDDTLLRELHRTIAAVAQAMDGLRFNTAIARITELNNVLTKTTEPTPRSVAEPLVVMLAPLVPHMAEELWEMLGHAHSVIAAPFPVADESLLVTDTIDVPVQVDGKVRSRVTVPAGADESTMRSAALEDPKIASLVGDATPRKVIVVPNKLVNVVL